MKQKFFSIVLLASALMLCFSSCKKDEPESPKEEESSKGEIILDGKSYPANVGAIQLINSGDKIYGTISITGTSNDFVIMTQMAIFYPTGESVSGTYDIDETKSRYINSFLSNYSLTSGTGMSSYNNLTSGSLTVKDNGNNDYTVSFRYKPANGSEISGNYSGTLVTQSMN